MSKSYYVTFEVPEWYEPEDLETALWVMLRVGGIPYNRLEVEVSDA